MWGCREATWQFAICQKFARDSALTFKALWAESYGANVVWPQALFQIASHSRRKQRQHPTVAGTL